MPLDIQPHHRNTQWWVRTKSDEEAVRLGCTFDLDAALRFSKFASFARHTTGRWAGKPFELLPWQFFDFYAPLYGWKRPDGTRRFRRFGMAVAKKNGKALDIRTPVPTPSGWKTMADIVPGDQVFDERGERCNVTAVSEVMLNRPCYRVEFSDGVSVIADADHQWLTKTRYPDGNRTWTTEEISKSLRVEYDGSAGWNHSILVTKAVDYPEADLPVEPYLLGVWLGDGTSANGNITCAFADDAIIERLYTRGHAVHGKNYAKKDRVGLYSICGFTKQLRLAGLINNKHIPAKYLTASREQRIELLRGLMDTDGSISGKSAIAEFSNTNERLIDDVVQLVASLGYKPMKGCKVAKIEGREIGLAYRVCFKPFAENSVFGLERKAQRQLPYTGRPRSQNRHIVAVTPVESVPVKCLQVDSPSRCYLITTRYVPTHNSTISSLQTAYHIAFDREAANECYLCASDVDQARIVYREASKFINASRSLSSAIRVIDYRSRLVSRYDPSFAQVLSREAATKHGYNAGFVLFDEFHTQKTWDLWNVLKYAGRARTQPLLGWITTAGNDIELPWYTEWEYARGIVSGEIIDPWSLAVVYAVPESADPEDESLWHLANPSLGHTFSIDDMRADFTEAKAKGEIALRDFRQLQLNQIVKGGEICIPRDKWDALKGDVTEGRVWYAGLDLASTRDFNALVLIAKDSTGKWLHKCWFWRPRDGGKAREVETREMFKAWSRGGHIKLMPGDFPDWNMIYDDITQICKTHAVRELAFDPTNAGPLVAKLEAAGVKLLTFRQNRGNYNAPTREFERLVFTGGMRHQGNPCMSWMVNNCVFTRDPQGNVMPDRTEKRAAKIDGVPATIMALAVGIKHTEREGREFRGY